MLHSVAAYGVYWKQVDKSTLGQTFYYEAPRCYGIGCLSSYGTDSNYEDHTGTFLQDVGGSSWYATLSQYWDSDSAGQQVPIFNEVTLGGTWEDNSTYPNLGRGVPAASLQPADIQAEVAKAIQHNDGWSVGPDSLLFVYIPEEVQACTDAGQCTNAAGNGTFCGFHGTADYNGQRITYAVIPSPGDTTGCDATVTSPSTDLVVDNAINAEAHELVEAVTNQTGHGWSDPDADKTEVGGEVGDKCETDFPGRGSALADGGNVTINGHDYILQALWSDLDNACELGRVPVPYLDAQGIKMLGVEPGSPSIVVTGYNFIPASTVQWNGKPIPTTYYSNQSLGASIPAGDPANPGVAALTVTQTNTSGGTSNPQFVFIASGGAELTASTTVNSFGGTTAIGTPPNQLSVTATGGTGTLGLAQFNGNPATGDTAGSTGRYADIYASPTTFSSLSIEDCALNGGSQVRWFDPAAAVWKAASKQTYNATTRCAALTVDSTTTPSLGQLQGTALGSWSRANGYVVGNGDGTLIPTIDVSSAGTPIKVGQRPHAVVVSADGATTYVANAGDNTVDQVALASGTISHTFQVGTNPVALAITPNGSTVYAANAGDGTVSAIDAVQNSITAIPVGSKPDALALSPDGTTLYVANRGSNSLSVVSTAANQATPAAIPAGAEPASIALTADGKLAFVADAAASQVLPISLPSGTAGAPIGVGKTPLAVAITPDDTTALVANFDDASVTPIDLTAASPAAGAPISVGTHPPAISITPDGSLAEVANTADGTVTYGHPHHGGDGCGRSCLRRRRERGFQP